MTLSTQIFKEIFCVKNLSEIYDKKIAYSGGCGVDGMTATHFSYISSTEILLIVKKILLNKYKLSKYKLKLISKGKDKYPRQLSIPTIRDRIVLRAISDLLHKIFYGRVLVLLPQDIVKAIKNQIYNEQYTHFIKFDIIDFFPSIVHDDLLIRTRKYIRSKPILELIRNAIENPSVQTVHHNDTLNNNGIPQGLAVSNVLASIYLINFDKLMSKIPNAQYYRYVDDIVILCSKENQSIIVKKVISELKKLHLTPHQFDFNSEKSKYGLMETGFQYLGYSFAKNKTSVRELSINNLRSSIVGIFVSYARLQIHSPGFLLWKLNTRITGCIFQNKRKGWLFFFSEIDDESILHELDFFVNKLVRRFRLNISPKKFVRTYYQIKYNQNLTNYIPNFDRYTLDQQKRVLNRCFMKDTDNLDESTITKMFNIEIGYQVRDLLTDIKNIS